MIVLSHGTDALNSAKWFFGIENIKEACKLHNFDNYEWGYLEDLASKNEMTDAYSNRVLLAWNEFTQDLMLIIDNRPKGSGALDHDNIICLLTGHDGYNKLDNYDGTYTNLKSLQSKLAEAVRS